MNKRLVLSVLVLCLFLATVAAAKSWRVSGAIVHMRQGEYEAAIELLEQEVSENPSNAEAWAYLGNAAANARKFTLAAEAWSRAEDLYTQKNKPKELKKVQEDRMFFWDKAVKVGNEKLSRAIKFEDPSFEPAEGETRLGDLEAAVAGYVTAYHVFDGHPLTLWWLGITYDLLQQEYSALPKDEVRRVVEYDLQTGNAVERDVAAGEYLQELKRKSLQIYEVAVAVKSQDLARKEEERFDKKNTFSDYLVKLANAAIHLKEYDRALQVIDPILAENPDDLDMLRTKAAILESQGKRAESLACLEKAAALIPDAKEKADTLWRIGAIYLEDNFEQRDPHKAAAVLEQAEKLDPENYRVLIYLGKAYVELGETAKGAEYLKRGDELYKKSQPGGQ